MKKTLALAALALAAATLAGCGEEPAPAEPVIRPVRYQEVVPTGAGRERKFSGTARAGVESELGFRVPGIVETVAVAVGDRVRRGQTIARLDDADLRLQVQEAEAALAQAQAAERRSAADYDRVRGLYENRNAAKSELDAARAQAESSRAQVDAARRRLELARRQLGYARLQAPVDGAIAAVRVEENENVAAGQTVALLAAGERAEVEVAMPEGLIARIREGERAEVVFDALQGARFDATVTEVGVAATGAGATFPVTVRLDEPDAAVRSGMAATVGFRFAADAGGETIRVPPVAVGEDREGRFVFVLEDADATGEAGELAVARRRAVAVGELTPEGIEIREGLAAGELLVTAGVRRIADGQTVRLLERWRG